MSYQTQRSLYRFSNYRTCVAGFLCFLATTLSGCNSGDDFNPSATGGTEVPEIEQANNAMEDFMKGEGNKKSEQ